MEGCHHEKMQRMTLGYKQVREKEGCPKHQEERATERRLLELQR
jgi:hypothetical protein